MALVAQEKKKDAAPALATILKLRIQKTVFVWWLQQISSAPNSSGNTVLHNLLTPKVALVKWFFLQHFTVKNSRTEIPRNVVNICRNFL
jgi:hypothetical protein